MSLPSSANQGVAPVQKQGTNIYSVMLMLSFVALVTGAILLYMELGHYGSYPWWNTPAGAGS